MQPTTSSRDPLPSWLIKAARGGLFSWLMLIINASLKEGALLVNLKEVIITPLLRKPTLNPE